MELIKSKKILAIGAHPDDVEYGCLGLLLKAKGAEKLIYVASLGSKGDPSSNYQRKDESFESLQSVEPQKLIIREKAGIESSDFEEISSELFQLINVEQPDLILTMGPHDTHQEHHRVYEMTISAARRSKASILCYGILSNTPEFAPKYFVDIQDVYEQKKKALSCHKSQAKKYYMTNEYLEIFHSHKYAALHGIRFSEAYEIVRLFN